MVKINADLDFQTSQHKKQFFKEYKDIFGWTYTNLKGIQPHIAQHKIELDTTIPLTHQTRYWMNPNYAIVVKHVWDKLLITWFIASMEEATWLSPIIVVPKKNGKLKICMDFWDLNTTIKDLSFTFH